MKPISTRAEGTNIFDNCSVRLTKKTTSGLSQIKIAMSEEMGFTIHSFYMQGKQEHSQKLIDIKKINHLADFY